MFSQPRLSSMEMSLLMREGMSICSDPAHKAASQAFVTRTLTQLKQLENAKIPHTDPRYQAGLLYLRCSFTHFIDNKQFTTTDSISLAAKWKWVSTSRMYLATFGWPDRSAYERECLEGLLKEASSPSRHSYGPGPPLSWNEIAGCVKDPVVLGKVFASGQLTSHRLENGISPFLPCVDGIIDFSAQATWDRCFGCRKLFDGVMRCGSCKVALCCSAQCQKKDWEAEHKPECLKWRGSLTKFIEKAEESFDGPKC